MHDEGIGQEIGQEIVQAIDRLRPAWQRGLAGF